ncbi:MAG: DUF2062 domain-containing protein [Candidatus Accumulibacter sp. UW26]|jgi:uncharacterized protein (DUF2062 family)
MFERLRHLLPTREQLAANRWLRWLGPLLDNPQLWRWSRRGVAVGVGVGVFFGLLIPVAQIPLSVAVAVALRANIPAAAASTLVTNPITFAPVYYAAYKLGAWLTGDPREELPEGLPADPGADQATILQRIADIGLPLFIGLLITATSAGIASYLIINLVWYWLVMRRRRRKTPRR